MGGSSKSGAPKMRISRRTTLVGAVAFIGLTAATGGVYFSGNVPRTAPHLVQQARVAVRDSLKDPSSAQFRDTRVVGPSVCGEVNAKNGYGAYTGFTPFYVRGGQAHLAPPDVTFDDVHDAAIDRIRAGGRGGWSSDLYFDTLERVRELCAFTTGYAEVCRADDGAILDAEIARCGALREVLFSARR